MHYTIVSYRSDGDDYCRGCHMASSGSEFDLQETEDQDQAAQWIADKLMDDRRDASRREVCEWEVSILCDGRLNLVEDSDIASTDEEERDTIRGKAQEVVAARIKEEDRKKAEKAAELAIAAEKKKEVARIAKLAHERAEFERLKQKFGA